MIAWPKLALTGIAITSALLGGIKLGADHVQSKWDGERAWQAIEANKALAANVARLRAAEAANAATQARLQTALQKARHEPIQPSNAPRAAMFLTLSCLGCLSGCASSVIAPPQTIPPPEWLGCARPEIRDHLTVRMLADLALEYEAALARCDAAGRALVESWPR